MAGRVAPSPSRLSQQAGFALLEIIVALIVLCSAAPLIISYVTRQNDQAANRIVAGQMKRIGEDVASYIAANYDSLSKKEPGSWPLYWYQLQPFVSAGVDWNMPNPLGLRYGMRLRTVAVPGASNRVEGLVYTYTDSGKMPDVPTHAMPIAQVLGVGGVYVDYQNRRAGQPMSYWGGYGEITNQAAIADFAKGVQNLKKRGAVFYLLAPILLNQMQKDTLDEGKFLHRKSDSKHPEYNTMETHLSMGDSDITQLRTLYFDDFHGSHEPKFMVWQKYGDLVLAPDREEEKSNVRIQTNLQVSGNMSFTKTEKAGDKCPTGGALAVDPKDELLVCSSKSKVWRPVAPFQRTTGRDASAFSIEAHGAWTNRLGGYRHYTWFFNHLDTPIHITVGTKGHDGDSKFCALGAYRWNNGYVQTMFFDSQYGGATEEISLRLPYCSGSVIIPPNEQVQFIGTDEIQFLEQTH